MMRSLSSPAAATVRMGPRQSQVDALVDIHSLVEAHLVMPTADRHYDVHAALRLSSAAVVGCQLQ